MNITTMSNMEYEELYKNYKKLLEENKRLRHENEGLKQQLGLSIQTSHQIDEIYTSEEVASIIEVSDENSKSVSNQSSPQSKIDLFMSLFRGRDDVYAKRWESKDGRTGYSPVCLNEWVKGICDKPTVKCSDCGNKNYAVLDSAAVDKHLRGNAVFGIYPMLEDETCWFLSMDFDGEGWEKDVFILRQICIEKNIPIAVERSRSGDGAHAWFFFEDKISAASARKLGTALLTYAMSKRHEIKFNSYDRLFPNQDTLPKGGFGNLIALPLQLNARKNQNSLFINEQLAPYGDQWEFLSNIRKLNEADISSYISQLSGGNELGDLRQNEEGEGKPWEKSRINSKLTEVDFPEVVKITRANMLYIDKSGFSQKALNTIKRLAAFKNPDFYKSQAMRLPTFDKPRVISLADEASTSLRIPRGCSEELTELFGVHNIQVKWKEERNPGNFVDVEFNGILREEQQDAAHAMLQHDMGVLSATTAFGKTVIGAKLISERKVNTLVLVHTRQLLEQWKERLEQFLTINEIPPAVHDATKKRGRKKCWTAIGQLGGGKNNLSGIIDIAVMQSLTKGDDVKEFVRDYGMVIVDECHHVPAFSFEQILKSATGKYVYGLTATPIRQDGHHPIIFMQCGPVRYKVDARKQAERRPFEHYVIPRFTPFRKPISKDEKDWTIGEIYSVISTSQIRNQIIIDDVLKSVAEGRNPIVLTERTEHVKLISETLSQSLPNVIALTGRMSAKERRTAFERLSAIPQESNVVIVSTGRFVGEGFDEPRLDTLFLAMPVAWKGTVQQYAGRLHRLYQNKSEVQIYDYVDVHVGVLERMYHKRLRGYAAIGYTAKADSRPFETTNAIFDNHSFLPAFSHDVSSAKSEIVIVSPYITKKRLSQMLNIFSPGINNGVKLVIITRPESNYKEKDRHFFQDMIDDIEHTGANVIFRPDFHQKFAVIDQQIVWYGSINLLSFGNSEESIMRLDSLNIANELLGTIDKV